MQQFEESSHLLQAPLTLPGFQLLIHALKIKHFFPLLVTNEEVRLVSFDRYHEALKV